MSDQFWFAILAGALVLACVAEWIKVHKIDARKSRTLGESLANGQSVHF